MAQTNPAPQRLPRDYHAMALWLRGSGSFQYYIDGQQEKAAKVQAPIDALYERDGVWTCVSDLAADHWFRPQYQALLDDYWLNGTPAVRAALESLHTRHWNKGNGKA